MSDIRKVDRKKLDKMLADADVVSQKVFDNTQVVTVRLPSGFVISKSFSFADKRSYDEQFAEDMCMTMIYSELMVHEAYHMIETDYNRKKEAKKRKKDKSKIAAPDNVIDLIIKKLDEYVDEALKTDNPFTKELSKGYEELIKKSIEASGYNYDLTDEKLKKRLREIHIKKVNNMLDDLRRYMR